MDDSNATTIRSYDEHIQEYVSSTIQSVEGVLKEWTDNALAGLPQNAKILEFGSAFGRDADYIESKGFTVERTDVAPGFVKLLQDKGHEAHILNAITDGLGVDYDLVYADGVLVHFNRDETRHVIGKVYKALKDDGRFALGMMNGEGETWSETKLKAPLFFCFWTKETIEAELRQAGFSDIQFTDDSTLAPGTVDKWMRIVAIKRH